jgi:N4-gp56 family major capsid protein
MKKQFEAFLPLDLQYFAQTKLANMVDPEVMADMISAELPAAIKFTPLARVDNTLVGRPGSTVTVPKFKYIGDAVDVAEGADIDLTLLETQREDFTIKKAAKGVQLTDEAVLSGYGDPIGEAKSQLLKSIASKVDNDLLAAAKTATLTYTLTAGLTVDAVNSALEIFNDEDEGISTVLVVNPKDASKLRKEAGENWTRASDLGDNILIKGTFGELLGAQVIRSRKITEGTALLIRAGALGLFMKRNVDVETDRDIVNKTTVFTADEHYGAHIYDDSKIIYMKP